VDSLHEGRKQFNVSGADVLKELGGLIW